MMKLITLRIPEDLYKKLQKLAKENYTSAAPYIRKAIAEYIKKLEEEK